MSGTLKGDYMSLKDLFTYREEAEIRRNAYIKKADAIGSIKDIEHYERHTVEAIKAYEASIETLKEYRKTLYTRYQEICAAPFKMFLHIERRINFDNHKRYIITISKRFEGKNIKDEEILREVYEGRERHKALARFEALKKEYPNIENDTDIAKRSWER